jgi:hypothetical protein
MLAESCPSLRLVYFSQGTIWYAGDYIDYWYTPHNGQTGDTVPVSAMFWAEPEDMRVEWPQCHRSGCTSDPPTLQTYEQFKAKHPSPVHDTSDEISSETSETEEDEEDDDMNEGEDDDGEDDEDDEDEDEDEEEDDEDDL